MDKQLHLLETFRTRDASGSLHTVRAYEHWVRVAPTPDPLNSWEPTGLIEFRLEDGRRVTELADGTFQLSDGGERLERMY